MIPARKGDLVAYSVTRSITYAGGPTSTSTVWRVGEVAQASREGIVKKIRVAGSSAILRRDEVGEVLVVDRRRLIDPVAEIVDGLAWRQFPSAAAARSVVRLYLVRPS